MGTTRVQLCTYAQLIASKFNGTYEVKNERMSLYLDVLHAITRQFIKLEVMMRLYNDLRHADSLAYLVVTLIGKSSRQIDIGY